MTRARHVVELEASAADALAMGYVLARSIEDPRAPPVSLYGATLIGDSAVLGAFQRARAALRLDVLEERGVVALRRATGGPAVRAGEGIVYVALGLRDASTLMETPPDRVLNRNIRGLLTGLSAAGVPAHYFGREFVSVQRRPAAFCGWARWPTGTVMLELFLAHERTYPLEHALCAYPARSEPALLGKEPITLREAWGASSSHSAADVLELAMDRGYVGRFSLERADEPPTEIERAHAAARRDASVLVDAARENEPLRWSSPHEVPIGFVQAGLALDPEGRIEDARVAGDVFQDDAAPGALRAKLRGSRAEPTVIAAAINETYGRGAYVIEGLRELGPMLSAFVELLAQ